MKAIVFYTVLLLLLYFVLFIMLYKFHYILELSTYFVTPGVAPTVQALHLFKLFMILGIKTILYLIWSPE